MVALLGNLRKSALAGLTRRGGSGAEIVNRLKFPASKNSLVVTFLNDVKKELLAIQNATV